MLEAASPRSPLKAPSRNEPAAVRLSDRPSIDARSMRTGWPALHPPLIASSIWLPSASAMSSRSASMPLACPVTSKVMLRFVGSSILPTTPPRSSATASTLYCGLARSVTETVPDQRPSGVSPKVRLMTPRRRVVLPPGTGSTPLSWPSRASVASRRSARTIAAAPGWGEASRSPAALSIDRRSMAKPPSSRTVPLMVMDASSPKKSRKAGATRRAIGPRTSLEKARPISVRSSRVVPVRTRAPSASSASSSTRSPIGPAPDNTRSTGGRPSMSSRFATMPFAGSFSPSRTSSTSVSLA